MKTIRVPFILLLAALSSCAPTTHETTKADLGAVATSEEMIKAMHKDGTRVEVTRVDSARWQVDRAGMINLDHERAEEAGLESGLEPIVISFYEIEHPHHGRFMIDSGVAHVFRDPETAPVSSIVASAMNMDLLEIEVDTRSWIRERGGIEGVFLTHIHLDHVMGIPDIGSQVPIFVGPGETEPISFLNMFTRGTVDGLFADKSALREWPFKDDPSGRFEGILDIFSDGSLFAIHVPGHSPGHTAYLARTSDGSVLIVGDASHTDWGWRNCVEPGEFNHDLDGAAVSLKKLRVLETELPDMTLHLGHQHHHEAQHSLPCF